MAIAAAQAQPAGSATASSGNGFRLPSLPAPAAPSPAAGSGAATDLGLGIGAPLVVRRVRFEGAGRLLPEADLQALVAPFLNRPLRALEVEELRQRVTRALVQRGFVNSGAVFPEAPYADGTLTVRLVQGTLSRLRQAGLERLHEGYIAARLPGPDEPLDANVLQERFQLLLADPLFAQVNARLLPGEALGQAALELDVQRARPWSLGLHASNHLAPAVGSAAAGLDATVRNLTGWGDTMAVTTYASDGTLNSDASFTLPMAARTTLATLRLARTRSSLIEEPVALLDIASRVTTREFGLSHPFIDGARRRFTLGLTHALRRNTTTLAGEPFSVVPGEPTGTTRIEAWRLAPEFTWRLERHVVALRAVAVRGRNNATEAPAVSAAPPVRYRLWQLQTQAALALGDGTRQVMLRAQAQHSASRLVPLEQMAIGGRFSVRGYRENTLVRDSAASASAELHWPVWRSDAWRGALRLVPFFDAGVGANQGERSHRLSSAGLGFVLALAEVEGELFAARRLERPPAQTSGDLQDHGIHVALRYRWP
ncbi:MAG: ShlB/FhaC/HecB family hemolysin secretion/activation protein [Rubrivivax sp.]|nr:ShlB/FhaC/HecB family hemolysin secretion/activation protein [Rubrivivax sp.]